MVLAPAERLTIRIYRSVAGVKEFGHVGTMTICKGRPFSGRGSRLGRGARMIINAPKQIVSRVRQRALVLSRVGCLVVSRTSRVLGENFVSRIRTVVGRLPSGQMAVIFSTALPGSIRGLYRGCVGSPVRVGVRSAGIATSAVRRSLVRIESRRGVSLLGSIAIMRGPSDYLVFYQAGRRISAICDRLSETKCPYRELRKKLRRRSQFSIVRNFGLKGFHCLITASMTTENVSVSGIALIVGCSIPVRGRDCMRQAKEANHTKGGKGTVAFSAPFRKGFVGTVRECVNFSLPTERTPDRLRITNKGTTFRRGLGGEHVMEGGGATQVGRNVVGLRFANKGGGGVHTISFIKAVTGVPKIATSSVNVVAVRSRVSCISVLGKGNSLILRTVRGTAVGKGGLGMDGTVGWMRGAWVPLALLSRKSFP